MPTSTLTSPSTVSRTGEPTASSSRMPSLSPSHPENDADALPVSPTVTPITIALFHYISHPRNVTIPQSLSHPHPVPYSFPLSHCSSALSLTMGWQWSLQRSTARTAV